MFCCFDLETEQVLLRSATTLVNLQMLTKGKAPYDAQEDYLCSGYCREVSRNDYLPTDIIMLTKSFYKSFKSLTIELKGQALKNLLNGKQRKKYIPFKMQFGDVSICGKINIYPDGKPIYDNHNYIVSKGSTLLETAITQISYSSKAKKYSSTPSPIRVKSKYILAGQHQGNNEIYTRLHAKNHSAFACTKIIDAKVLKGKQYKKYLQISVLIDIEWITDMEYESIERYKVGDTIETRGGKSGVIKYIGPLQHLQIRGDNTIYIGVRRRKYLRHNRQWGKRTYKGWINDVKYFKCSEGTGEFIKPDQICGVYGADASIQVG